MTVELESKTIGCYPCHMGYTMTKKGQVTIPAHLREAFNLVPGDEIVFTAGRDGLSITKKIDPKAFRAAIGKLKNRGTGKNKGADTMAFLDGARGKVDLP